jgi:hypothetical protein
MIPLVLGNAMIIMLLNHFPNITALDLCRGQSEVRKEVTKDLGDTDTCLPDLERIRISWFVDDAEAKKILCGGRFARACVLISTTPERINLTRILTDETFFIVDLITCRLIFLNRKCQKK